METEAATSSYELENITRAGRRPSAGATSATPFRGFAMTPMEGTSAVDVEVEDDAALGEASTFDATVTKAARRASRGADSGPFKPMSSFSQAPMPVMLDTPPETPTKGLTLPALDPFAPTFTHSLPPTPGEAPDPFGSDTEHEAGAGDEVETYALPPVDRGAQAWGFLVAATAIEAVIWGLPYSVGVLHEYWVSTLFGPEATSTLTLASTLQTGLLFFSGALLGP